MLEYRYNGYSEAEMDGGDYGYVPRTNMPESRRANFSDPIDMVYAAESTTIGAMMHPIGGPFCYFCL